MDPDLERQDHSLHPNRRPNGGAEIGFTPKDVSAQYLREGGVMALLTAQVDPDTIRIMERWRSNTIICYLHTMSKRFTDGLDAHMFQCDNYAIILPEHAAI